MLSILTTLALVGIPPTAELPPLATIREIREIGEAGRGRNVRFSGIVTYYESRTRLLYIEDASLGISIQTGEGNLPLTVGDRVEVTGKRREGPTVEADDVLVREHGPPPPAPGVGADEFKNGRWTCRRVSLTGVLRSSMIESSREIFYLEVDGQIFRIFVNEIAREGVRNLPETDSVVRVVGVCSINLSVSDPFAKLMVQSFGDLTLIRPASAKPFDHPKTSISKLPDFSRHLVRIQGMATASPTDGILELTDSSGKIRLPVDPTFKAQAGDRVDAIGYPFRDPKSGIITLTDTRFRRYLLSKGRNPTTAVESDWLPVTDSFYEIRRMSQADLERHLPVQTRATVLYQDPIASEMFLHDGQEGIFASGNPLLGYFKPGTVVEIQGKTDPGGFAPVVDLTKITRIRNGAFPVAKRVTYPQLVGGALDSQWVEIEGHIGEPTFVGDYLYSFPILFGNESAECQIRGRIPKANVQNWQGSFVTLRAVCASHFDLKRQWLGPRFCVPDESHLTFVHSRPEHQAARQKKIRELADFSPSMRVGEWIQTDGEIIARRDQTLIIQDEDVGIELEIKPNQPGQIGERVRVIGIPRFRKDRWILESATIVPLPEIGRRIVPNLMRAAEFTLDKIGTLIEVEGELIDHLSASDRLHAMLMKVDRNDGTSIYFSATFPLDQQTDVLKRIQPGSHLRVTGACVKTTGQLISSFRVLPRTVDDIEIVAPPDYFTPERMKLLAGSIAAIALAAAFWVYSLRKRVRLQTERMKRQIAKEAMLEEKYREFIHNASDVAFRLRTGGTVDWINPVGMRISGLQVDDPFQTILAADSIAEGNRLIHCDSPMTTELSLLGGGSVVRLEISAHPIFSNGTLVGVEAIGRDVTQRRLLEAKLRHSSRMEAIGRLAGGVAHDFNNLLTVINGNAELLRNLTHGESAEFAGEILQAGGQASSLTRQLLAFSRKDVVSPKVVCPNEIVLGMRNILDRLVGERIRLTTDLEPDVGSVRIDPRQLEQAILNLSVNARDAMPSGGDLFVCTRQSFGQVLLEVRDSGIGMDEATRVRIFEPFFTTKADEGTGIGLATVHMIVERAGGHITVESALGSGTTFRIFLPLCGDIPELHDSVQIVPDTQVAEKKVILLAEDEPSVQLLERRILESNQFQVIAASSGEEALSILENHPGPIDLLMTDVVMPGINGRELAEEVERRRPGISVLFLSGYTPDEVLRQGVESEQANFLQKPFTPNGLLAKVKDVLSQLPV